MSIPPDGPAKLRRIRAKTAQLVRDLEYWNEQRHDAPPFDVGAERAIIRLCDAALQAAERGDGAEYGRLAVELAEQAQRAVAE